MSTSFPKKAMILSAGLGERLRPLTAHTPKPMIDVAGYPLIVYNLMLLKKFGIQEVVINLHHLGEKISETLGEGQGVGLHIHYTHEKVLLGTGGGLKAAENFFEGEPHFILMNGDILIDLDLQQLFEFHQQQKRAATLVTIPAHREDIKRWVFVDGQNQVADISAQPPHFSCQKTIFAGVQVLTPEIFNSLPTNNGEALPSCIVQQGYLPLLKSGKKLGAFVFKGYWRDLGTLARYEEVQKEFVKAWPYTALSPENFPAL